MRAPHLSAVAERRQAASREAGHLTNRVTGTRGGNTQKSRMIGRLGPVGRQGTYLPRFLSPICGRRGKEMFGE